MGVVDDFSILNGIIKKLYIKFNDHKAGLKLMETDAYAKRKKTVGTNY